MAYAASALGVAATVVMPANPSRSKAAAATGYGAQVVLHGEHVGEALAHMDWLRDEHHLVVVHPFDDPEVIAGAGTVGLEIVDDLPEVDVVVVAVGGGGLIGGIASAVKARRPRARVYGVEPELSNALSLGVAAGVPVRLDPRSIADGLGAPFAGSWAIDIARGVRFALERMKQLLEPAGATALGAFLAGRIPIRDGETVAVVASGGNVDLGRLPAILELAGEGW